MIRIWIFLWSFLAMAVAPGCSRQGDAQGGSADPQNTMTSGVIDGATEPRPPGPPMNYEKAAVTNISELFNTNNPTAFWTRAVDLSGVPVQQVFADGHFIVVGPDKNHTLVVQMGQLHPEIKVGQKVDLSGVIDPTGVDKSQWNVRPEEQKVLAQHSIFIQERSIQSTAK